MKLLLYMVIGHGTRDEFSNVYAVWGPKIPLAGPKCGICSEALREVTQRRNVEGLDNQ